MPDLPARLLGLSPRIRYAALYLNGRLDMHSASGLRAMTSEESDSYEELIVNPTLLTLLHQRALIGAGKLDYVVVGYGGCRHLILALPGGHVSVAAEPGLPLDDLIRLVRQVLAESGLAGRAA